MNEMNKVFWGHILYQFKVALSPLSSRPAGLLQMCSLNYVWSFVEAETGREQGKYSRGKQLAGKRNSSLTGLGAQQEMRIPRRKIRG